MFDPSSIGARPLSNKENGTFDPSSIGARPLDKTQEEGSYLRMAAQVPRNLATGAAELLDLPNMAANLALSATPLKYRFNQNYFSDLASKGIDALTGGYTSPKTKGERIAESGAKAIGSTLTGYGAGVRLAEIGVKGLSKLGRGLAKINPMDPTSLAATGAGGAAQQAYQEGNPDSLLGSLVTGLAADVATRSGLNLANKRKYAPAAAKILNVKPSHAESFHEMDVSPTLGQISDNPIVKSMENTLRHVGFSGKLRNDYDKQYKKMIEILGPGAQGLAQTELQAGQTMKETLKNYKANVGETTEKLKENFMKKVDAYPSKTIPHDLVPVKNSSNFITDIEKTLKTMSSKEDILNSPLGKNYTSLMAKSTKGAVPLPDLLEFRTNLSNEISEKKLGKVATGRVRKLIGKITGDLDQYMKSIGAEKEWKSYNRYYANYAENRKPHVLAAENIPELYADKLFDSIGHSGKLNRGLLETVLLTQNKPHQNQTVDALFQKMGKRGDNQDVHLFAERFSSQSKETQNALLSSKPKPLRNKIRAVIDSINRIKDVNMFGNPSRTAYTSAIMQAGQIGALSAYDLGRGNAPSDTAWKYAILTASSIALSRGVFTNPKFINWVLKGAKMTPKARVHHIAGIKGILGRPVYQEIKNALSGQEREK